MKVSVGVDAFADVFGNRRGGRPPAVNELFLQGQTSYEQLLSLISRMRFADYAAADPKPSDILIIDRFHHAVDDHSRRLIVRESDGYPDERRSRAFYERARAARRALIAALGPEVDVEEELLRSREGALAENAAYAVEIALPADVYREIMRPLAEIEVQRLIRERGQH